MPKSSVGPVPSAGPNVWAACLTARIMARGQEDSARGLTHADHMARGRRAENAALADDELADAIGSTNLCNQLRDLWVPVAAVAANDQRAVLDALGNGQQDAGDEGLAVVRLLEDLDFLAQARADGVSGSLERRLDLGAFPTGL